VPAVRREGYVRHHVPERDRVDELHVRALNREHADGVVGPQRDERPIALRADVEPGGLLPDRDRAGELGRIRLQVDDVELVIGRLLQGTEPIRQAPLIIRLFDRFPFLRRIPGRIVGLGVRRERVRSPAAPFPTKP